MTDGPPQIDVERHQKWPCTGTIRTALAGCWSAAIVCLIGCGTGASVGDISGAVTYEGEPLPAGRISFVCDGGDKPSLMAGIKESRYEIKDAPVGLARVTAQTALSEKLLVIGIQ